MVNAWQIKYGSSLLQGEMSRSSLRLWNRFYYALASQASSNSEPPQRYQTRNPPDRPGIEDTP
ncbi:MAG: hypothetical protein A2284_16085 [Deltaproteobacteria bacterium RIFOXYA12_FULL_61_11]|nr:MAG: hypothetical protein A2284_16085 [Deltaproteobacteria bacterium RIFOXYA12_FULL_61_11]